MINIQKPVYYCKFRHIQAYSRFIKTFSHVVAYLEPCVTLVYSEPYHIQNPGIFRTYKIYSELCQGIFRTLCNARILRTMPFTGLSHIRCLAYLGPKVYSESCFYRHIQAYSGIFDNDSYNNINFLFCHICHFSTKFRKTCFLTYNNVSFNAWLSLLKGTVLINDRLRVSKVSWKLSFLFINKNLRLNNLKSRTTWYAKI